MRKYTVFNLFLSFSCALNAVFPPQLNASEISGLQLSAAVVPYELPLMKGLKFHTDDPLRIDFLFTSGTHPLSEDEFREQTKTSVNYFLTALTIKDDDFWVNLSPYEKDRIIPDIFGKTLMGQAFLEQDYILKRLTASYMHPDDPVGSKFWQTVYERAYEEYGITDIPTESFHKIWITPESAAVHEQSDKALVTNYTLDVMMENDYLAKAEQADLTAKTQIGKETNQDAIVKNVFKTIILPEIKRHINEGEYFSDLRQIYHAVILASWFKTKLKNTALEDAFLNQNKILGLENTDSENKESLYQRYLELFSKGVFSEIKEEYDPATQSMIPRRYFSGGLALNVSNAMLNQSSSGFDLLQWLARLGTTALLVVTISFSAIAQQPTQMTPLSPSPPKSTNQDSIFKTPETIVNSIMTVLDEAIKQEPLNASHAARRNTKLLIKARALINTALRGEFNAVRKNGESDIVLLRKLHNILALLNGSKDSRVAEIMSEYDRLQGFHSYNTFDPAKPTLIFAHGFGRGIYDNFEPFFNEFRESHNIVFFIYNETEKLDTLSNIFVNEWSQFKEAHPGHQPLTVIAYSFGNIVFRGAVLNDTAGHFKDAKYIALVPPFAGSKTVKMTTRPEAKIVISSFFKKWYELTQSLAPYGATMKNMFSPESNRVFFDRISAQYVIKVEQDIHNPSLKPKTKEAVAFKKRYEAALGENVYTVIIPPQPMVTLSQHTYMTHVPETLRLTKDIISKSDHAALQTEPVGGIDFNSGFLKLESDGTNHIQPFFRNLKGMDIKNLRGLKFTVGGIVPLETSNFFKS